MILPKLNTITHQLELPSTGEPIIYRPYTVEEEKILLTTQESDEASDVLRAMRQIISNCVQSEIDIQKLPTFDIEYLFLNIRSKSIGDEIELLLRHENSTNSKNEICEHRQPVKIMIDEIKVHKTEGHKNEFQLDENVGLKMKYPTFETLSINNDDDDFDQLIDLIVSSIEIIYDKEKVYDISDIPKEEVRTFICSMNQKQLAMVQSFFETMPILKHEVRYVCSKCGCEEIVEVKGFQNFFS